jgi:hypothetical protein
MRSLLGALALVPLLAPSLALAQTFTLPLNQVAIPNQVSGDAVSSFVFVSPLKSLASLTVSNGAAAGFAILFDAISAPSGAVTPCTTAASARPCVLWCVPMAANTALERSWASPILAQTGLVAVYSTTGCATVTASATARFAGQTP